MAEQRFDRDRFAYELAQELGIDYARVPTSRAPGESVRAVQDGVQSSMEVGPRRRGTQAAREDTFLEEDVDGGASGLSTVNRARATPTRSSLDLSPASEAERNARRALADDEIDYD